MDKIGVRELACTHFCSARRHSVGAPLQLWEALDAAVKSSQLAISPPYDHGHMLTGPKYPYPPSLTCPHRVTHQSPLRLIRSVARPARRMGDLCRQVSWLAARTLRLAFPA